MHFSGLVALLALAAATPAPTSPPTVPAAVAPVPKVIKIHATGSKARKQDCTTDFTIDEAGNWTAKTRLANGRNRDGDHFQAILILHDTQGRNVVALNEVAGVEAAEFCKGSCVRNLEHSGQLQISSHDLTDQFTYKCTGWDSTDDQLVATSAVVMIGCAFVGGGYACSVIAPWNARTGEEPKKPED